MIKLCATILMSTLFFTNVGLSDLNQDIPEGLLGAVETIELKQTLIFDDGLEVLLVSFSHKHPYKDGPTKATAYIQVAVNGQKSDLSLSVYGSTDSREKSFESKKWNGHVFELVALEYNKFIKFKVTHED